MNRKVYAMNVCINSNMVSNNDALVKYKTSERKQLRAMIPKDIYDDIVSNIPDEWRYDPAKFALEVTRRLLVAKECEDKKEGS
jgi:hypothetical protein